MRTSVSTFCFSKNIWSQELKGFYKLISDWTSHGPRCLRSLRSLRSDTVIAVECSPHPTECRLVADIYFKMSNRPKNCKTTNEDWKETFILSRKCYKFRLYSHRCARVWCISFTNSKHLHFRSRKIKISANVWQFNSKWNCDCRQPHCKFSFHKLRINWIEIRDAICGEERANVFVCIFLAIRNQNTYLSMRYAIIMPMQCR